MNREFCDELNDQLWTMIMLYAITNEEMNIFLYILSAVKEIIFDPRQLDQLRKWK